MNRLLQRLSMLAVLFMGIVSLSMAQRTVTGTVKDESGIPMIGVNIVAVGTTVGTVSDFDGTYKLEVPEGTTQLQFSYTGYEHKILDLGSSDHVDVMLGEGTILEDVVVTGYGTVKREDVTGAITTVRSDQFNKGQVTSPQELITGKVAGVTVVTDGAPGSSSTIRIRGGSSLSATNDPLVIIDGIPVSSDVISGSRNYLNIVNPNDIESFTVLKDASATAIYGSRASNGVIIITTKKGSLADKFHVDYSGNISLSTIAKRNEVLSPTDFKDLVNQRYGTNPTVLGLLGTTETDWQDQIYQDALGHDHLLALSGAVGSIPFRVSGGYTYKEGLLKTDNFNRTTLSLNLNPGFLDNKLQFNLSAKGMIDKNHFADRSAIGAALFFDPTQPVTSDDPVYDQFGGYYTYLNADNTANTLSPRNPVAVLNLIDDDSNVKRYILGGQMDYRFWFLEDLRLNLNAGYDFSKGEGTKNTSPMASWVAATNGRHNIYEQKNTNSLFEAYLDYNGKLGDDIRLGLMGGYSWQHFKVESSGSEYDFSDTVIFTAPYLDLKEYYLVSLFGRANLTLFDDFLVSFTVRRDGTSRFSKDRRWGTFPGVAVAWKILNGDNMLHSSLKLRLGYGVTGQQGISDDYYPYLPRYQYGTSTATYQFGDEFVTVLRPAGYDANLKWEETTTYNVGLDYSSFDDRVYGAFDVYFRKTKDLINKIPVPAGTNLTNELLTNVGDLENKGVEFSLNTVPVRTNKTEWTVGFNMAYNFNKITKLTAVDDPTYEGVNTGDDINGGVGNQIQIHSVGYPANAFWVFEQVYDKDGNAIEGLYVDRNGDGVHTDEDLYRFKKRAPDVSMGVYTTLKVGHFDFTVSGHAMFGNYVYNNNFSNQSPLNFLFTSSGGVGGGYLGNLHEDATDLGFNTAQYFSDLFVQDASFFRLDNITAGYDFGSMNKGGLEHLRIWAAVQNPLLVTKYKGIDPEVFSGIDNNIYPRSRTFVLGVNVGF